MNSNIIYDIFKFTEESNMATDLDVGLIMFKEINKNTNLELILNYDEIRNFIFNHYEILVDAYKFHDKDIFKIVVEKCEEEDKN